MNINTPLPALACFVAVVEHESFTGAADALGVSKSHVSKQVSALEDHLGTRLLNRSTRRMSLTDVGRAYYERCAAALADLEEAELAVTQHHSTPRGVLRLSVPMSFGVQYLSPLIAEFGARWPDVRIDVELTDRVVNILDEGIDLAVRIGQLADSSLIARRIAWVHGYLVASPAYLAERGAPEHPDDLRDHDCLVYEYQGPSWTFTRDDESITVRVDGRVRSNNGEVLVDAARRGLGIAWMPDFLSCDALSSGDVVPLLPDWSSRRLGVWAVYPHNRHLSAKVRLFVDLLAEAFGDVPPWAVLPSA